MATYVEAHNQFEQTLLPRIHSYLQKSDIDDTINFTFEESVYVTNRIAYLCFEIVEGAGYETLKRNSKKKVINLTDARLSIIHDGRLSKMFSKQSEEFFGDSDSILNPYGKGNEMTLTAIIDNIDTHFTKQGRNIFKNFECKIKDDKSINDSDPNILSAIDEIGIYQYIFDFLQYEEIEESVHKTCKLFHKLSCRTLNKRYYEWICNGWLERGIFNILKEVQPELKISKRTFVTLSGLLTSFLNEFIDAMKSTKKDDGYLDNVTEELLFGELIEIATKEAQNAVKSKQAYDALVDTFGDEITMNIVKCLFTCYY